MLFCVQCGKKLPEDAAFCGECGKKVEKRDTQIQPPVPTQPPPPRYNYSNQKHMYKKKDYTDDYDPNDCRANRVLCAFSYIGILFFLPMLRGTPFCKFHANQALLTLLIKILIFIIAIMVSPLAMIFIGLVSYVLFLSPSMEAAYGLCFIVYLIIDLTLTLIGFVRAMRGKAINMPFFGNMRLYK